MPAIELGQIHVLSNSTVVLAIRIEGTGLLGNKSQRRQSQEPQNKCFGELEMHVGWVAAFQRFNDAKDQYLSESVMRLKFRRIM
jgi:hypothetical protein